MIVRVEKSGNRILLGSDFPISGLKNSIPGAYFRSTDKVWSVPLDLATCALLRRRFKSRLEIGPALWDWAKAETARVEAAGTLSLAADAELKVLPDVAPKLAAAMSSRTYQRVAVRYLADAEGRDGRRRGLLADTVGLGKTAESLGAVLEAGIVGPYLIITPKTSVESTWVAEINEWLPGDEVITLPEIDKTVNKVKITARQRRDDILDDLLGRYEHPRKRPSLARTWVVVHPAAIRTQTVWVCALCGSGTNFRAGIIDTLDCGDDKDRTTKTVHNHTFRQLFGIEWGAVIVDESHQILIRKTGTPNLQRRGAEMIRDLVPEGGARIAMSGTPMRSKPHQIWSTLNWLDPKRFSAKWSFIQRFWETENGFYGGMTIGELRADREELLKRELTDIMLRRERTDVRDDLPPRNYAGTHLVPGDETSPKGVWLPMAGKQLKAYQDMERYAAVQLEGGSVSPVGVLAELTRLRQFAGSECEVRGGEVWPVARGNKYERLLGICDELGFPDEPATKLVIVSQFTKLLKVFGEGLSKELGGRNSCLNVAYITGQESQATRTRNVAEFEQGGLNVMFLNTITGGASITLDAAEIMVFLDETFIDDDQEQAEGRIDNRKPEKRIVPRTYYYLRSLGSIEERIAAENAAAKAAGRQLLGANAMAKKVLAR